jgi:hypothetical protein
LLRAYNKTTNNHVYTTRQSELDELTGILGFKAEGTTGWVLPELPPMPPGNPSATFGHPPPSPPPATTNLRRVYGQYADNLLVPSPVQGLASRSNYIINNMIAGTCQAIRGLTVEIEVTEDIVCSAVDQGAKGFSFQVNCESIGSQIIGWQQYVISLWGPSLIGIVNNYYLGDNYSIIKYTSLLTIGNFTLAKGWKLKIELIEDKSGNILGVNYRAFDANLFELGFGTQLIANIDGAHALGVAPIGTVQVVLVGPINGEAATLSSGRGTFTISSSTPMRPAGAFPPCVLDNTVTGESANSVYSALPDQRALKFVQEFSTKALGPGPGPIPLSFRKWMGGTKLGPPLPPPPPERPKSS